MGGDCIGSDLVFLSTGNDFLKMVIDVACGTKPAVKLNPKREKAEIRFIFTYEDITELEKIKANHGYDIYRISDLELDNLGKTFDSGSRVGYYILK